MSVPEILILALIGSVVALLWFMMMRLGPLGNG